MFQKKVVEKFKTHFTFNNFFEKIMPWKNTVQPDRPQMTIQCMRFVCWITKVTGAHSEYVILFARATMFS
jgi:hypothetical protein